MLNDEARKSFALEFARALSERHYATAHAMCTADLRSRVSLTKMRSDFEGMIPLDWGPVAPIELVEIGEPSPPHLYVSLGGEVYSEAITVYLSETDGKLQVERFELGRP
jgi:hypothetical protein